MTYDTEQKILALLLQQYKTLEEIRDSLWAIQENLEISRVRYRYASPEDRALDNMTEEQYKVTLGEVMEEIREQIERIDR